MFVIVAFARGRYFCGTASTPMTWKSASLRTCSDNYQGHYYAKAQNLARTLRAAYDEALKGVDLLLMPTLPLKATVLPPPDASREVYVARALEMISNTCPFDVTGHPAVTVPAGMLLA